MATGISGSIQIDASGGYSMKVEYSETYDVSGNYSVINIDGIYIKATSYYGWTYYPDGIVKVNGTAVVTMNSNQGTGSARTNALNQWYKCSNSTGSSGHITHNADGTKTINIEIVGNRYSTFRWYTSDGTGGSGWGGTKSSSVTLTTIPRASTISVGSLTIGSAGTISISRASSSFTHTITYSFGSASGTIASKTSNVSVSWTPAMTLCNQVTNAVSKSGTLTCKTYNGSTEIGSSSITFTASVPASVVPSVSTFTDSPTPSWGLYVATKSKCTLSASASGSYGSTIKSYQIKQGSTVLANASSVTTGTISSAGSITYTVTITDSRGRTASKNVTITVYALSTVSSPAVNLGSATTITISKGKSDFKHTVSYSFGTHSETLQTKTTVGSFSWTPDVSLADAIPNALSGSITLTCKTFTSGGTEVGQTTSTFTVNVPTSVKPTVDAFTNTIVNNGVPSSWGIYVKGISQCKLQTTGSGIYGSTIKSYQIKQGNTVLTSSASVTTPVLTTVGSITYTVIVTDSRGRTASSTTTINVVDYNVPTIQSVLSQRCLEDGTLDDEGTYVRCVFTFTYSPCAGHNTVTAQVRWRKNGSSDWSSPESITSGTAKVVGGGLILNENAWYFEYSVSDQITSGIKNTDPVSVSFVTVDFKTGGKGMGVFGYSQTDGALEIYGDLDITGTYKKNGATSLANLTYTVVSTW